MVLGAQRCGELSEVRPLAANGCSGPPDQCVGDAAHSGCNDDDLMAFTSKRRGNLGCLGDGFRRPDRRASELDHEPMR
jgi:hypothetical protein